MKINIFGVGRSGTKALQLYLTYIIAKNEGKAYLNYEPYNFITRRGPLNYLGIYYNYNSDLFIDNIVNMNKGYQKFIKSLLKNNLNNNSTIITKFINANGRISAINQIMKPDLTIIIIRDLYETLNSLARMKWDYLSFGYFLLRNTYINIWQKMIDEIRKNELVPDLNYILKEINDIYHQNALYWYVMNLKALKYRGKNTIFINYHDFKRIPELLSSYFPYECDENIKDLKFIGTNIHRDYPLENIDDQYFNLINRFKIKLNEFNYYLFRNKMKPPFFFRIGNLVKTNNNGNIINKTEEASHIKINIEKTKLMDFFNSHIMTELEKTS